jgi:uncharacterized protein YbaP (TraB family)
VSPFLWRLDRDPPSYFFGTIHVPYNQVWPTLPKQVSEVFLATDAHYFELDPFDTKSLIQLTSCQHLPADQQLEDVLPPTIMARLRKHLVYVRLQFESWMTDIQRKLSLKPDAFYRMLTMHWQRRRPIWIVILLQTLTRRSISSWGEPTLDLFLAIESHRIGKRVGAIERVEEQCQVLNSIHIKYQIYALDRTLTQHEQARFAAQQQQEQPSTSNQISLPDLIQQYNCGNFSKLNFDQGSAWIASMTTATSDSFMAAEEERIKHELLHQRDKRMANRVVRLLRLNPTKSFFFAFGVAHFLANLSVLSLVQQAGFPLQRYTAIDDHRFAYTLPDGKPDNRTQNVNRTSSVNTTSVELVTFAYDDTQDV